MSDLKSIRAALRAAFPPKFSGVQKFFADIDGLKAEAEQLTRRAERIERLLGADRGITELTQGKGE
ncbi:hypothetical protein E3U23_11130 [Erythrobacter litoralis]|uniref:hypothetical protein n=1 Tax=Erythrobacter litoralis TaxID=39960 RepID=UPI002434D468|nr:hypothetical protein [Erythrobacter litoralis]MDG6079741.1 hypothetical protein [Erythrobacter litoralis]